MNIYALNRLTYQNVHRLINQASSYGFCGLSNSCVSTFMIFTTVWEFFTLILRKFFETIHTKHYNINFKHANCSIHTKVPEKLPPISTMSSTNSKYQIKFCWKILCNRFLIMFNRLTLHLLREWKQQPQTNWFIRLSDIIQEFRKSDSIKWL